MNSPNCKSNDSISTVILLVALAALIYYLTSPSKPENTDNFEEVKPKDEEVKPNMPVVNNYVKGDNLMGQYDTKLEAATIAAKVGASNNSNSVPAPAAVASVVAEKPAIVPVKQQADIPSSNDIVDAAGADLSSAYGDIVNKAAKNSVDLNQKNVINYDAHDFLPKEVNDSWFDTDFSQAKYNVNDDKLINTERYVIGINTVGQSLKNASYDIRGTVANPKFSVSPWNNSTYEPDFNIKPMC